MARKRLKFEFDASVSDLIYLELSGNLDQKTVDLFARAFSRLITECEGRILQNVPILLYMQEIAEIDCAGIRAIMVGYSLVAKSCPIHILANEGVAEILRSSGIDKKLRVYTDPKIALSEGINSEAYCWKHQCHSHI